MDPKVRPAGWQMPAVILTEVALVLALDAACGPVHRRTVDLGGGDLALWIGAIFLECLAGVAILRAKGTSSAAVRCLLLAGLYLAAEIVFLPFLAWSEGAVTEHMLWLLLAFVTMLICGIAMGLVAYHRRPRHALDQMQRSVLRRWRVLLACGLVAGLGFVFMARDRGSDLLNPRWMWELGGIILVVAVALYAAIRNVRSRWPAVLALFGVLPMTLRLLEVMSHSLALLAMLPWPLEMIVLGTIATIVAAAYGAIAKIPPPPPDDPIPTVRVVG